LIELEANTGGNDRVEFTASPGFHLKRTDSRRRASIFAIERIEICHANTAARIVCPFAIGVLDERKSNFVAPNASRAASLPGDRKAQAARIEGERIGQTPARRPDSRPSESSG